ncbi:MAG: hypothetical protein LUC85_06875 [Bacteroidales bacterium]|nr:hypothetical protein [Bacteroidales bacterium]MCD8394542.1 hypothetical protein [Bacteroidales bacterium]
MSKGRSIITIACLVVAMACLAGCRKDKGSEAEASYQEAVDHYRQGESLAGDSMLAETAEYFAGKEPLKAVHCRMLEAARIHQLGQSEQAIAQLDSLEAQVDFPPMMLPELVEMRLRIATQCKDAGRMLPDAKRLLKATRDMDRRLECLGALQVAFEQLGYPDSALIANDMILIAVEEIPRHELKRPTLIDRARLLEQSGHSKDAEALIRLLNDNIDQPSSL